MSTCFFLWALTEKTLAHGTSTVTGPAGDANSHTTWSLPTLAWEEAENRTGRREACSRTNQLGRLNKQNAAPTTKKTKRTDLLPPPLRPLVVNTKKCSIREPEFVLSLEMHEIHWPWHMLFSYILENIHLHKLTGSNEALWRMQKVTWLNKLNNAFSFISRSIANIVLVYKTSFILQAISLLAVF